MKKLILILLAIASIQSVIAQSFGEIQGKIINESGDAVPMPTVYVEQGSKTVVGSSDMDGKFKIKPLESGSYTLIIQAIGYVTKQYIVNVNPDEITFMKELELKTRVHLVVDGGGPPVIYAEKMINPEQTSKITIKLDDFKHSPALKNITTLATVIAPNVKEAPDGSGLTFKGARTGANVYFLDGVKIMNGQGLPRIPSSGIKSMTVYTGGVPAKYGDLTGGVIIIETKDYFSEYNKRKYANK